MQLQRFRKQLVSILSVVLLSTPMLALGQEVGGIYRLFGLHSESVALLIMRILQIIWILLTLGCAGVAGYGFYLMQTARGDIAQETSGKSIVKYGGIATIVSLIIAIILSVIVYRMNPAGEEQVGTTPPPSSGEPARFTPGPSLLGAFSKIQSHYPQRDEKNVARNTAIAITFGQPILLSSVQDAKGKLYPDVIIIHRAGSKDAGVAGTATLASDNKTLTIVPDELLGDAGKNSDYSVQVTTKVLLPVGTPFFEGGTGYTWQFQVGGTVDTTPPQVESVFPDPDTATKTPVARNATVIINFSEPIDASALADNKIEITNDKGTAIEGSLRLGNNYKTLSFIPKQVCGQNECNQSITCFAPNSKIKVVAHAASLASTSGTSSNRAKIPFDGVVDLAGNSLDGGGANKQAKNSVSDGSPKDDYSYSFAVSGDTSTISPRIVEMLPARDAARVSKTAPVSITFSQLMDPTTLNQSSVILGSDLQYTVSVKNDIKDGKTTTQIDHSAFKDNTSYTPQVTSDAHDVYQSCFAPCNGPTQ